MVSDSDNTLQTIYKLLEKEINNCYALAEAGYSSAELEAKTLIRFREKLNDLSLKIEVIKQLKIPGWISVKDRLPEKNGRYLVSEKCNPIWVGVCSLRNGKWDTEITHWMPLPEPPNE